MKPDFQGYAAKQMADWLYEKKSDFYCSDDEYSLGETCLVGAKTLRLGAVPPSDLMKSVDGTIKYLYPAGPGNFVESVYIPTEDRRHCVFLPGRM